MSYPIQLKIRGVFIPVSHIEAARDWCCSLLDLPTDGQTENIDEAYRYMKAKTYRFLLK